MEEDDKLQAGAAVEDDDEQDFTVMQLPSHSKSAKELFDEAMDNPDQFLDPDEAKELIDEEFPDVEVRPTPSDMDRSVTEKGIDTKYKMGHWIERIGSDMKWHLEPIRRVVTKVIEHADGKEETQIFYKTNSGLLYHEDEVRAPREGLIRIFGCGPLLWQQWALLKTEEYVRFQPGHERDFQLVNFVRSADLFFNQWLKDPRNSKFKALYDSRPVCAQEKLRHHLFKPFQLMLEISEDTEKWDFEAAHCSIYQYNSLLGSGYLTSLIVLFIQLSSPFLILVYAVRNSNRFPLFLDNRNVVNYETGNVGGWNDGNIPGPPGASYVPFGNGSALILSTDLNVVFWTTWDIFCHSYVSLDQFFMNIIVFLVYTTRVVPFIVDTFYATVGDKDDVTARMNSLRYLSWLHGDDYVSMQFGFKLERYINTFYVALVNVLMLFVLFLTTNTVSIILNALAIEFVYNFDKEVARSIWYDPGRRFITAGTMEMVLRSELILAPFTYPKLLCRMYDIDEEQYHRELDGHIYDEKVAVVDRGNAKYLTAKDRLWAACAEVAIKEKNEEAMWQFTEKPAFFGIFDRMFQPKLGGIFKRYEDYFTWSRWDKLLYMCRVPEFDETLTLASLASNKPGKQQPYYLNENPFSQRSTTVRFFVSVANVLTCRSMIQSVKTVYGREKYHQIPFRVIDGALEWFVFLSVVILFPAALGFYLYLIFACEPLV